jgi:hypothetical protein
MLKAFLAQAAADSLRPAINQDAQSAGVLQLLYWTLHKGRTSQNHLRQPDVAGKCL